MLQVVVFIFCIFFAKSAFIQPRTSPDKFAVWKEDSELSFGIVSILGGEEGAAQEAAADAGGGDRDGGDSSNSKGEDTVKSAKVFPREDDNPDTHHHGRRDYIDQQGHVHHSVFDFELYIAPYVEMIDMIIISCGFFGMVVAVIRLEFKAADPEAETEASGATGFQRFYSGTDAARPAIPTMATLSVSSANMMSR